MRELHTTSLVLAIIGGINWGLIGLFNFDLVAALFGEMSLITRMIYSLIGMGAFALLFFLIPQESSYNGSASNPGKHTP